MRSRFGRTALVILALVGWANAGPHAQAPTFQTVSPFDIVGFVDAATLTPADDGFSGGGTITVNGTVITVPANTLLQMPAFALTWQEVFTQAPVPYGMGSGPSGQAQSGLAKSDVPAPYTTYEVRIQGNRVGNQYIAGLMFVSQQSANAGAGFINYIDYATGELRVGGTIGDATTGARVVINDPAGKFGRVRTDDARFTIDEDNPTVRSETAYPMCIPRTDPTVQDDPLCPQINRPKGPDGNYLTIFTTDYPPLWYQFGLVPGDFVSNGTDSLRMAPFEVGDFVDYNGSLTIDAKGPYISAWGVIANIGLFTQAGAQPAYTAIDVMLLGVGGRPDPNLPQEAAVRTRIEGFTTDPSSFVMLSAIDVDPCTATESERFYAMVSVDPGVLAAGAPGRGIGAVAGRWRWRPSDDAPFLPPTRMLRATTGNGAYMDWNTGDMKTPNGLAAGVYTAPNFDFIFPENLGVGSAPVPSNFQDFPFLAHGSGPYPANPAVRLGQLAPWPGAVAPVTPSCPADGSSAIYTPIADAGPDQTAKRGDRVTINAGNSRDTTVPTVLPLTFTWSQVSTVNPTLPAPPTERIAAAAAFTPQPTPDQSFLIDKLATGRNIADNTVLTFRVDVTNCSEFSIAGTCGTSSATMHITVVKNPTPSDTLTGVAATWRVRRSRLDVNATTSDPAAVLTVLGFGDMGPALPIAVGIPAPAGDRTFTEVGVNPAPAEVTVRSDLGAIITVPVTIRP
ncbi:MAG: hypothetical protein JWL71_3315 [Acidobacteria bacterium]|nr:hypothetical protein [Acidobacteriota bacterium]